MTAYQSGLTVGLTIAVILAVVFVAYVSLARLTLWDTDQ